jgi:hypothetical protein
MRRPRFRGRICVALFAVLCALGEVTARGQSAKGGITGIAADHAGVGIPGAT